MGTEETDQYEVPDLDTFLGRCKGPIRLIVVAGDSMGQRYRVGPGTTLGRSSSCTVLIADPRVSRQQARLESDENGVLMLVDDAGKGTTRLNGESITRTGLRYGDRIQLGQTVLVVAPQEEEEREELEQDRLKAIGYLSAGIAHDFNNMLGVISSTISYLDGVESDCPLSDPDVRECLEDVRAAADRSADLVKRMLVFARQETDATEMCNVADICQDVLSLAQRGFSARIRVESSVEPGLWVFGARSQLVQMVLNLCINARDAMAEGGVLRMEAIRDRQHPEVKITVSDTGVGMDDETRARIFDRFFTTKEDKGTGLGLALVSEVVRWHGGRIAVESKVGRGTSFHVHLPFRSPDLAGRAQPPTAVATPSEGPTKKNGRILIVDDDAMVLRSTARLLQQAGHETITATDGMQAVRLYSDLQPQPDLVLLDLDMRGLDGEETWLQLRRADPAVRVAFLSGYTRPEWSTRLVEEGALAFVQKPYAAHALIVLVASALTTSQ